MILPASRGCCGNCTIQRARTPGSELHTRVALSMSITEHCLCAWPCALILTGSVHLARMPGGRFYHWQKY